MSKIRTNLLKIAMKLFLFWLKKSLFLFFISRNMTLFKKNKVWQHSCRFPLGKMATLQTVHPVQIYKFEKGTHLIFWKAGSAMWFDATGEPRRGLFEGIGVRLVLPFCFRRQIHSFSLIQFNLCWSLSLKNKCLFFFLP